MHLKSIQVKITLWAGLCLLVAGGIFLTYLTVQARNTAFAAARKQALTQAQTEAIRVQTHFERAFTTTRLLAQIIGNAKSNAGLKMSREGVNNLIKQMLLENPQFAALSVSGEALTFEGADGAATGPAGRGAFKWSVDERGELKSLSTEASGRSQITHEALLAPSLKAGSSSLQTTLITPISVNGKFSGVIEAEFRLDFLQRFADATDVYHRAGKFLLASPEGRVIALTGRPEAIGNPVNNISPELSADLEKTRANQQVMGVTGGQLRAVAPLAIGKTEMPWTAYILIPTNVIGQEVTAQFVSWLTIFCGLMIIALTVLWYLAGRLAQPIRVAVKFAHNLAHGVMTSRVEISSRDETGQLLNAMNGMLDNSNSLVQSEESRNQLQQSIIRLLEQVSQVAQGDLSREVAVSGDVTGTIADAFNYVIAELRRIIGQVQNVTRQVSHTANFTQTTTTDLEREAQEQTNQLNRTALAIEAMAQSIQRVTQDALLSATVAQESLDNAQQGTEAVQNTIEGMQRIRDQVQETAKKLKRLGESSQEIGEIVQIIGGISKRTSYLALNAAIQAAEAGESGHGFTVVAEEIERLAKRSADATKRINNLVRTIQTGAHEAISAMEESTREVVDGSHLANQAGQALHEIHSVSQRLAELIESISKAAATQSQNSRDVNTAMTNIAAITERTTQGIKKSSTSVHDLAALAQELRTSVAPFKLPVR